MHVCVYIFLSVKQDVLPVSKQLEYFREYKMRLRQLVGARKAENIIKNAVAVMSMGTNDFLQNYYLEPIRPKQYTLEEYQNYLASCMSDDVKVPPCLSFIPYL